MPQMRISKSGSSVNMRSAFKRFQGAVSRESLNTRSGHIVSYYDYGPKSDEQIPLVCLHGIESNMAIFFKQIVSLAARGYRVISFSLPVVYDHQVCTNILQQCFDQLKFYKTVHIYGCGLGVLLPSFSLPVSPEESVIDIVELVLRYILLL